MYRVTLFFVDFLIFMFVIYSYWHSDCGFRQVANLLNFTGTLFHLKRAGFSFFYTLCCNYIVSTGVLRSHIKSCE